MPTHCTCQDLPVPGSMHLCTCCVVCGVVEDKTHTVLPEVQINYDTLTYQCNSLAQGLKLRSRFRRINP